MACKMPSGGGIHRISSVDCEVRIRKRIEEGFGWVKEVASLAQVKLRGLARVDFAFVLTAYDLGRLPRLLAEASP